MEITTNTKVIETSTCKTWVFDNVVMVKHFEGSKLTLDDVKVNMASILSLIPSGKCLPLLVDMRNIKSMSGDARNYATKSVNEDHIVAVALLVESTLNKLIANFFIGLNKSNRPVRLFTKENEAIAWFKGVKM